MSSPSEITVNLPPEQRAIRAQCYHPSGTFAPFAKEEVDQAIPDRFDKIIRTYPARLAIKTKDLCLTYLELNQAANRVAQGILRTLNGSSDPVLFVADHGTDSIIGCLGILKAGKILIAIDPACPAKRIRFIRDESQATAILTDDRNFLSVANLMTPKFRALNLKYFEEDLPRENPNCHISPQAPAEIRYSSGSTGQPKGIIRTHQRLLHSAMLTINSGHICPDDRLLAIRRLSFGCNDILKGLLVGATLCPFDITKSGFSDFADFIEQQEVTYYTSSSSTFRHFMAELTDRQTFPSVRVLQLGDDPLSSREIKSYKRHFSDHCILMYRLSCGEAGNLCQYFIDKNTEISSTFVPVGYPVEGKEILLLDESGRTVEPGATGEISVKSEHLSSEYLRKPELTRAKFLPDPAGGNNRIYLTGDLGKMLPDGRLLHLGRKDLEVKIRGCKVALPEIEAALREFAGVVDAAVKVWGHESGEPFLVAYLLYRPEPRPKTGELQAFLKTILPDYMIPSRFVFLHSLPLVNGKLDRSSLPPPDKTRLNLTTSYMAPRTTVEKDLVEIWAKVLSIDEVGIDDNFFELGGHSLAATRVVSRVIKKYELDLPLQSLFQSPTIAKMAAKISLHQGTTLASEELDRIVTELESLSDEEAKRLIAVDLEP